MRTTTRVSSAIVMAVLGATAWRHGGGPRPVDDRRDGQRRAIRPAARRPGARWTFVPRRGGPRGPPGRLSRPPPRDPGPGVLQLPAALQPGAQRPDPHPEGRPARRRLGLRRGGRQHQPRGDARAGRAEEGGLPGTLRPARARSGAGISWSGDREPIDELCRTIGFRYRYNPQTGSTPTPRASWSSPPTARSPRYFYGIDYPPKDLESEIRRAAGGRIGSPIGRLLLLCYDYDAATGKYTLSIVRLIRVLGHRDGALAGHVPPGHVPAGAARAPGDRRTRG